VHSAEPLWWQLVHDPAGLAGLIRKLDSLPVGSLRRQPRSDRYGLLRLHKSWTACSAWRLLGQQQRQPIADQPGQFDIRLLPISHVEKLRTQRDLVRALEVLWTALDAGSGLGITTARCRPLCSSGPRRHNDP
jgi:hypothetical protein